VHTISPINVWLIKAFFTRCATCISHLQRSEIWTMMKHPGLVLDNLRSNCTLCPVHSTQHGVSSSSTRIFSSWVVQFRVPLKSLSLLKRYSDPRLIQPTIWPEGFPLFNMSTSQCVENMTLLLSDFSHHQYFCTEFSLWPKLIWGNGHMWLLRKHKSILFLWLHCTRNTIYLFSVWIVTAAVIFFCSSLHTTQKPATAANNCSLFHY